MGTFFLCLFNTWTTSIIIMRFLGRDQGIVFVRAIALNVVRVT